jgi:hypothetical protein
MSVALLQHQPALLQAAGIARATRRFTQITGQSLAKAYRHPRYRAHLAAGWVLGSVQITPPTVALASRVFGVSVPLIDEAITEIESTTVVPAPIEMAWSATNAEGREQFARNFADKLWAIMDRITA